MAKPSKVVPEFVAEMKRLYARDVGVQSIARRLGLSPSTVWRALRKVGVQTRARGVKGTRCREDGCRKPTDGARRCPLHVKIRTAENNLLAVEDYQERRRVKAIGLCRRCGVNPRAVYNRGPYSYCAECERSRRPTPRSSVCHLESLSMANKP